MRFGLGNQGIKDRTKRSTGFERTLGAETSLGHKMRESALGTEIDYRWSFHWIWLSGQMQDTAAIRAMDNRLLTAHLEADLGRHLHVTSRANIVLQRDNNHPIFAFE